MSDDFLVCPDCGSPVLKVKDHTLTGADLLYCPACFWHRYF